MSAVTEDSLLLQVIDLKTYFYTETGVVRAVDGVSLRSGMGRLWDAG
jgi:ABC-type dipeptide/oligopeptide/nickel transport system ATPase component